MVPCHPPRLRVYQHQRARSSNLSRSFISRDRGIGHPQPGAQQQSHPASAGAGWDSDCELFRAQLGTCRIPVHILNVLLPCRKNTTQSRNVWRGVQAKKHGQERCDDEILGTARHITILLRRTARIPTMSPEITNTKTPPSTPLPDRPQEQGVRAQGRRR